MDFKHYILGLFLLTYFIILAVIVFYKEKRRGDSK